MGIDVEDIKLFVCRIVHLSLRVSHRFVQKHPYVSGTLLFLFILHIFLPSVLSFLFYSLPFFGLTVILLAFWTSKRSTTRVDKVGDKLELSKQSTITVNRNRASLRNATSRRQRFKEKSDKAWSTEAPIDASVGRRTEQSVECDNSKAFIKVKETQCLDGGNNASANTTSVDKDIEVSGQNDPVLGSKLQVKPDLVGCDGSSSQTTKSDSGGDETKNDSSEEAEDEDEEEAQEERNKAVQWTEDDQKNLMDLGLSEIERNRRLESLIARRRARKLYKRKVEETALTVAIIPPGQIPKIITTRNDPLDLLDKDLEGVPLPGSAPSILLPMRNPFDLPYDPHEEKPNLMADSFQQEFTAAHQRELSFCRHESFCFGPSYPSGDDGGGLGYHPRYRRPSNKGDHDWLIEQLLFKGDQVSRPEKNPNVAETREDKRGTALPSDTTDVDAMELESDQGKEIPADSESEFEMEPELTEDGKCQSSPSSSSENPEDVIICDDVAVVSQSFEKTLSNALNKSLNCLVPKSRLIKEPLCDFSPTAFENNKMEERFPYPDKVVCHTPTYSIASDLQVEVSEIGSPPTVDGNNTDGESLNPDWEIEKEVNFGGELDDMSPSLEQLRPNEIVPDLEEEGEVKALSVPDALPPKTIQSAMIEELVDQPSQVVLQMPEELSIPTDDDEEAINHTINRKDADAEALANMGNMAKTSEDIDGGLEILMKQEDGEKKTGPLEEETDPKCSKSFHDHEHLEEGSRDLDQITGNGDLVEPSEHGSNTGRLMKPSEIEEQLEFIPDNKNQLNAVGTEFQSSKDALKSTVEDESVTDGVPLDSNAILSLESSMKEQIHVDGSSLSNSNGKICSEGSQNQASAVESEFQKSNDAMKSTVEQDSVNEGVPLDSTARLSPKSLIGEQLHVDKVSSSQDCIISPEKPVEESIINDNNPKTMENRPADSIEAKSELIKDLSEQHDQNLSTPNPELNADLKMTETNVQGEVAANPLKEIHITEVQTAIAVTNKNMGSVGNCEGECESHRFNKQESDVGEEKDLQFDKDMETYSKDLNGTELKPHVIMGLQKPTGSAHENSVDCSLSAEKGSQ